MKHACEDCGEEFRETEMYRYDFRDHYPPGGVEWYCESCEEKAHWELAGGEW